MGSSCDLKVNGKDDQGLASHDSNDNNNNVVCGLWSVVYSLFALYFRSSSSNSRAGVGR